jgi:ribosomal protein L17
MYLGLPIITYTVNYNIETTENKAKYFSSKNELISLITNLKQQELSIIAKDMKKVANINYTWKVIATHYAQLFNQ